MGETSNGASVGVESLFVRGRNVLLSVADLAPIFNYFDTHLAENQIAVSDEHRAMFATALAAFTMHCASRPRNEHLSWTINFQQPLVNLFLVGDTSASTVAGRVFSENVKQAAEQNFYQEFQPTGGERIRSHVNFTGHDPLLAAEQFYDRSEQRPARFFQLSATRFAILTAHPDWDEAWFREIDQHGVSELDKIETLVPIEQRLYRWECGCGRDLLLKLLKPMMENDMDGLFEGDPAIEARCPRCDARYEITRAAAETYLAEIGA